MIDPAATPVSLGRGAVIGANQAVPRLWAGAPIFEVGEATLSEPDAIVDEMHRLWSQRHPYVVRLCVDPRRLKELSLHVEERAPWQLGDKFSLPGQRLLFLTWNNNWDMRSGTPVWWWTKKGIALGATESDAADVRLADGTDAWIDGGPLAPLAGAISYVSVERGLLTPIVDALSSSELADDQRKAVEHRGGSTRVIAPAGSGKTRVLTERLRHVLQDWHVDRSAVCAVAYNTRAAGELSERTAGASAHIRTLNSLAFAIVNGTGGFARSHLESSTREVIGEPEVRRILQGLIDVPRRSNTDPFAVWIEALSAARLGLKNPSVIESSWDDVDGFAVVFNDYRTHLERHNQLDFDEQILRAIEILLQDADARATAQRRCRMLLVDEFQDLTPAHMLLLRLLAAPALDVFGVGDDDQVIYGYAGATPDYLVSFDKWFPGAGSHSLEVNYRCPPSVIEAASNTLTRNAVRVDKRTRPAPDRSSHPTDLDFVTDASPARATVDLIAKWTTEVSPSEVAVLSRVNVTLMPVQVLLAEAGVPHRATVDSSVLDRTGMRSALAYLRMALNPDAISRGDVLDTIRRPSRKIARNVTDMMTKRRTTSVSELRRLANALSGNDAQRVLGYASDITRISDAIRAGGTEEALKVIKGEIGLSETLATLDGSRREVDRSSHADDLTALSAVAHLHPEAETFEAWLRSTLAVANPQSDGIELATVHRVKGREWDRVVVFGADTDLMPHRLANDRAEERRVFHVAITRCRNRCTVMSTTPSPFIAETTAPGEPEKAAARPDSVLAATRREIPAARAFVGMEIDVSGSTATVVDLTEMGAMTAIGKAQTLVPFGTVVSHQGKRAELRPPRSQSAERIFEALKEWRYNMSRRVKAPAYTILHDAHLEGIAEAAPKDLEALSRCKGVGPSKLEKWGDEILAVLDDASAT